MPIKSNASRKTSSAPDRLKDGKFAVIYDPAVVWAYILPEIARGRALAAILQDRPDLPCYDWCKRQLRTDAALRAQYDTAVEERGDYLAEEIVALADSQMPEGLDGRGASAWVQQLRLRVDARRWTAARLRPRVWGDRLDVSVTNTQISITAALAAAEKRLLTAYNEEIDITPIDTTDTREVAK